MNTGEWLEAISNKISGNCAYFEGRETEESILPFEKPNDSVLGHLIEKGYRRFDKFFYRSDCPDCRQCMSYRVPVADFRLSQNMKRVMRQNRDLEVRWHRPEFRLSKARLYLKYQREQHPDSRRDLLYSSLTKQKLAAMKMQMFSPVPGTLELTLYLNNRLVGFAVFDQGKDALSAVYSVYDTEFRDRSLGTEIILQGLRYAVEKGIPYFYLGYYIPLSDKMNYKNRFKPGEIRDPFSGSWIDAEKAVELINCAVNSKRF